MKFSIRDLLLVTVIVALALGWWVDNRSRNERMRKEVDRVYQVLEKRAPAPNPPNP